TLLLGPPEIRAHAGRSYPGLIDHHAVLEDQSTLAAIGRRSRADRHARAHADSHPAPAATHPHAADAEADARARLRVAHGFPGVPVAAVVGDGAAGRSAPRAQHILV